MAKTIKQEYLEQFSKNCLADIELTKAKNADYSSGDDAFENFRLSAKLAGVTVAQSILVRISDKISRISNLLKKQDYKGEVVNESITDSLEDLRVYTNLLQTWFQLGEPPEGLEYLDLEALEIEGQSYTPPIEEPRKPTITDALLKWTKIKG